MEPELLKFIEIFPAVAILGWIVIRQQVQIEKLMDTIVKLNDDVSKVKLSDMTQHFSETDNTLAGYHTTNKPAD